LQVGEMMIKFKVEGMRELEKSLKKLGNVPQKHVTASARKGMSIVRKDAKTNAPRDTGALERGIVLKGERSKLKAKKVYRVVFDDKMNDIFQKKNEQGDVIGYYPVSQEYGYFTKSGRYIPGFRFIHNALNNNTGAVEKTIVNEMKKKIDQEIARGGLR
jgi:HK97 gp10 family phage protein